VQPNKTDVKKDPYSKMFQVHCSQIFTTSLCFIFHVCNDGNTVVWSKYFEPDLVCGRQLCHNVQCL